MTALGVAYLLVFQLLLIGVSAGIGFSPARASSQDTILCLGAPSETEVDGTQDRLDLPPCCSLACPMVGMLGLGPQPRPEASPLRFARVAARLLPAPAGAVAQHEGKPFHARGPPAAV
ncbi:hypothetical protein ACLBXM_04810 [Xanthobacteraceae bacterium A53D]